MITLLYISLMKRILTNKWAIAILAIFLIAAGCKQGQKKQGAIIDNLDTLNDEQKIKSFSQIYHLYPSPGEMLSIINLNEMTFDGDLLNPVERSGQYLDNQSKTQLLGVYMTDLAYCALFGRHEATLDYLEVVRTLADEIRIESAIDDAMIAKAKKNVEYLDSLYTISNEAFMNILSFCEKNERSNTVVLLSAGAFVESMYLAVNLIDDYSTADRLLQHLADQKYTIDNFIAFAESVRKNDPEVASTIDALNKIYTIYQGIDPGTGEVTVKTEEGTTADQPKKLVIGSSGKDSQASLSEEEFTELRSAVIELRNKIVNE